MKYHVGKDEDKEAANKYCNHAVKNHNLASIAATLGKDGFPLELALRALNRDGLVRHSVGVVFCVHSLLFLSFLEISLQILTLLLLFFTLD